MAILSLVLGIVSFAAFSAWQSATETNARLDRNLVYLRCQFDHLNDNQVHYYEGLKPQRSTCVPSHR